ncbi:unnamed protein product [Ixodes pacificus]
MKSPTTPLTKRRHLSSMPNVTPPSSWRGDACTLCVADGCCPLRSTVASPAWNIGEASAQDPFADRMWLLLRGSSADLGRFFGGGKKGGVDLEVSVQRSSPAQKAPILKTAHLGFYARFQEWGVSIARGRTGYPLKCCSTCPWPSIKC